MRAAWLLVVMVLAVGAQVSKTPEQEAEKILGRPLNGKPASTVQQCQAQVKEWQDWYERNIPIHTQLRADYAQLSDKYDGVKAENDRLNAENSQVGFRIFVLFAGIGAGLSLAWVSGKAIRHWWPMSKQRRQLITLLLMAAWVTVAAVLALSDSRLSSHPVNLVLSVFVYSLPALTFGGVAVWWFGRTKPEIMW